MTVQDEGIARQDLFALGVRLHEAGHMIEAEHFYRQALAGDPVHPGAYSNLGLALKALGRTREAFAATRAALLIKPDHTEAYSNLGVELKDLGRLVESLAACRAALRLKPDYAEAHYNRGNAWLASGQLALAVAAYRTALCLKPTLTAAQYNLGNALTELCRWREACVAYNAALRVKHNYPEAHSNLGNALKELGRVTKAVAAYRAALCLKPDHVRAHVNLGNLLRDQGRRDDAVAAQRAALRIKPDFAEAHSNLANTLKDLGRLDHAAIACHASLCIKPECAEVYATLGVIIGSLGRQADAVAAFRTALRIKPDYADAHHALGMVLLLTGHFAEGWRDYEWRWQLKEFRSIQRAFPQPQWRGERSAGKTILLHAEQGIGDTIQFCRYAPLVAAQGGRVIFEAHRPLLRLLGSLSGVDHLLAAGDPLPDFDYHCPLISLPLAFDTRLETIPSSCPYLSAPEELVLLWQDRLSGEGLRIGIAWQGNPKYQDDETRSMPSKHLAALSRIARDSGIQFVSLQKQPRWSPVDLTLIDFMDELVDFADTAAVIANLDLVISVDTAVAHLAGAIGKPVWLLNRFAPDWRWLLGRSDSPWYPTMRLFRQTAPGDWDTLMRHVVMALESMIVGKDSV